MSTHNICFYEKITKIILRYPQLPQIPSLFVLLVLIWYTVMHTNTKEVLMTSTDVLAGGTSSFTE